MSEFNIPYVACNVCGTVAQKAVAFALSSADQLESAVTISLPANWTALDSTRHCCPIIDSAHDAARAAKAAATPAGKVVAT